MGEPSSPESHARWLEKWAWVQLRAEQESWLHGLVADAIREGARVSEGTWFGSRSTALRAGGAGWSELREALLAETRARARRW